VTGKGCLALACCAIALLGGAPATSIASASDASNPFNDIARAYLVEVDGKVVWHKAEHQRLAPASLTKLMTALLAAESLRADAPVTVSLAAAKETGSKLGLPAHTTLTANDLLAATLVASANDACHALADAIAGSQERFVQRMNQRARQMNLHNTHFSNACGHDAPDHYSSAEDLARLAATLMQNTALATLVAKAELQIASSDGAHRYRLTNSNALIGRYGGAIGIKTGTTPQAGKCLVALVRRGNHSVMLVLLKGKDRWWDATDVLDIAFAHAQANP